MSPVLISNFLAKLYINIYHIKNHNNHFGCGFWHARWPALESDIFYILNHFAQLYIHIYHISKFQNNPSSCYWDFYQTKFGQKDKNGKKKRKKIIITRYDYTRVIFDVHRIGLYLYKSRIYRTISKYFARTNSCRSTNINFTSLALCMVKIYSFE